MVSRKILEITFLVLLLSFLILLIIRFVIGGDEDTWLTNGNTWIKHGNPSSPMPK
jgi:hypothetical protein